MPIIAPSLLSADFLRLDEECKMLNDSEAEWFHLDVMDGRFVPNISFGLPIIEHIRKATKKVCDVHLMIVEPEKYAEAFKNAGADILSVHIEIDGGVTLENASSIVQAGADVLVAGNTVFRSSNPAATIAQLRAVS